MDSGRGRVRRQIFSTLPAQGGEPSICGNGFAAVRRSADAGHQRHAETVAQAQQHPGLIDRSTAIMTKQGVEVEVLRAVDHNIATDPGPSYLDPASAARATTSPTAAPRS
jgi:hypothetical protein